MSKQNLGHFDIPENVNNGNREASKFALPCFSSWSKKLRKKEKEKDKDE